MNIEDIHNYLDKKIRIITSTKFTYIGYIESFGNDFIRFRDKYHQLKIISLRSIDLVEEVVD